LVPSQREQRRHAELVARQKVLGSPEWINNVSWTDSTVYVDLTRGAIKNAPEYNASRPQLIMITKSVFMITTAESYWADKAA
jgi:hypothetical protein